MIDRFGRTIDYLRISLTEQCNLRCGYCMPEGCLDSEFGESGDGRLDTEDLLRIVRVAASLGISGIRITGGEPLVCKNVLEVVDGIANTPGIEDVSITTNGTLLAQFAGDLKEAGLNRVNVSLDSLDEKTYREVTRCGNLADVLAGIDAAIDAGLDPVKVNVVAIKSLDQDFLAFAEMSMERPLHVRFIEYMPVGKCVDGSQAKWQLDDVVSCDEILELIDSAAIERGMPRLEPAYDGELPQGRGPARHYRFPGALGSVGFISSVSDCFCKECNRLRLTSDGKLRPCLFSDVEIDMMAAVREGTDEDIAAAFEKAVAEKPDAHHGKEGTRRAMFQIGG